MNTTKILRILFTLFILGIFFYTGFLYGEKEGYNNTEAVIEIKTENQNILNSLSDLKINNITGSKDSKNLISVGKIYYKIENKKTEILIDFEYAPNVIKQPKSGLSKTVPVELEISLAKLTAQGQDYDYKPIGKLKFGESNNGVRKARFSTILDFELSNQYYQRIVFDSSKEGEENIFISNDESLPFNLRGQPSVYFWSIL